MYFLSQIFMKSFVESEAECYLNGELTGFDTDVMRYYLHVYRSVPGMWK